MREFTEKGDRINRCSGIPIRAIYTSLHLICMCVYGTKPNPDLWKKVFLGFHFCLLMDKMDLPPDAPPSEVAKEVYAKPWKTQIADLLVTLNVYHDCKFSVGSTLKKFKKRNKSQAIGLMLPSSTRSERLATFLPLANGYLVYCSSPSCSFSVDRDQTFRYCKNCKTARYCSEQCQKDHWENDKPNSHSKQCTQLREDIAPDHPVFLWKCHQVNRFESLTRTAVAC